MVYCGKPSKGCENCRLKRLKCDQKRPGCSQCTHTGRTCLGYRDENDLVFRDESQRITIKFQKKSEAKKKSTTKTRPQRGSGNQSDRGVAKSTKCFSPPRLIQAPLSIHQPIQDVAINFLLGDYIRGSHFAYLPSLYNSYQSTDVLSPIVKAVGLASLSLQSSRPELQDQAQKLYVEAIANTNQALQCADLARNDDVLASILLLSLYETLSLRTHNSIEAWITHSYGALSLVALRGPAQFESKFGVELFKQIAAGIRVFCVQHRIRVPQQLRELTQMAKRHACRNDLSFEYHPIVEAFTDLVADMAEGSLTEPSNIIARSEDMLQSIEDLECRLPADCFYDTVLVYSPSPEILGDYCYRFKDHYVTQMWNTTWMAKLHLNSLILQQVVRVLDIPEQLEECNIDPVSKTIECRREVIQAADNICASVPQFFPPDQDQTLTQSAPTAAMGYFLIWPLFTAGSSSLILPSTREYIIGRLEFIAKNLKLPAAQKAADMLIHDDCMESWMHIYHVF